MLCGFVNFRNKKWIPEATLQGEAFRDRKSHLNEVVADCHNSLHPVFLEKLLHPCLRRRGTIFTIGVSHPPKKHFQTLIR